MDQSMIAGMGNIYTDETLFLASIHPKRVSSGLSRERISRLYYAMLKILKKAIAARGSSVDNYVDARGAKGSFQNQHFVYGRNGEPCKKCGRPIKRIVLGGRSTHFCTHCQK
jgi:formamidopyrimidine-DNA glycosylase